MRPLSASRPDDTRRRRVASALRVATASHRPETATAASIAAMTSASPAPAPATARAMPLTRATPPSDSQHPSGHVGFGHQ